MKLASQDPEGQVERALPLTPAEAVPLMVAEYTSLRAEIVQAIQLQSQLLAVTVIAFGSTLGVAYSAKSSPVILIYPVLSLIVGHYWLNFSHVIIRIAEYIASEIEPRAGRRYMGWETFVRMNPVPRGVLAYWGTRSIFMGTAVLALLVGATLPRSGVLEQAALVLGIVGTVLTITMFTFWRDATLPKQRLKLPAPRHASHDH